MNRRTRVRAAAFAATALLGGALAGAPAGAEEDRAATTTTLARGLLSPLSVAVAADGTVYYSENFKGTLLARSPGHMPRRLFQAGAGTEVGAVSERRGVVRFATTLPEGRGAYLKSIGRDGTVRTLADLAAHERRRNPDQGVRYGLRQVPDGCDVPTGYPFRYTGVVESHPYGTAQSAGATYVADAAGNSVLRVGRDGTVSTVAVLPAVPVEVTPAVAEALELPACTAGATYFLEPVPTDVEVGPGGRLYVSSLPGGPEDGSTGAIGGVFRVDPRSGKVTRVAGGLVSATGVAVAPSGDLYVAELFGGRIAKVKRGATRATTVYRAPMVAAVELHDGLLYATTRALTGLAGDAPAGRVVRVRR